MRNNLLLSVLGDEWSRLTNEIEEQGPGQISDLLDTGRANIEAAIRLADGDSGAVEALQARAAIRRPQPATCSCWAGREHAAAAD